ncbi:hypothetical protein [Bacillus paramycoides]|uniref:hypothetical protein n=1 Tax=Bacillus paramycoides TaxID=2026194 RepID=UPI0015CF2C30|nr:hypothetical protein [Bacillus paramycoides]
MASGYYSIEQQKELDKMYTLAKKLLVEIKEQNNNKTLKETHFYYLSQVIEYWETQTE